MVLADYSRKQAVLTHLAVSTSIFFVITYLIVCHWYPDFYFVLDGGNRAIITIFMVDVVLGPGLTLLLFKPDKKGLKFDMAMVLLVQSLALAWGLHSVYTARPATTVFYQGKFVCVAYPDATEIDLHRIAAGASGSQHLSLLIRPDTIDGLIEFSREAYAHNSSPIYYYGNRILPLEKEVVGRLDKYELNLALLKAENAVDASTVENFLAANTQAEQLRLIPLACRYGSGIAVYDTKQYRITEILDVATQLSADALDEPLPLKQQMDNK